MDNDQDVLGYFQDDDDMFDDTILDAIDKQESIYLSTQQQPEPLHVQDDRISDVPTIDTAFRDPPTHVQPLPAHIAHGQLTPGDPNSISWHALSQPDRAITQDARDMQHQQKEIDGLRFTVERLQLRLAHDQRTYEDMLRELNLLRSEKQFMEQELMSARMELRTKDKEKDKKPSAFPSGSGFSLPGTSRRSRAVPPRQRSSSTTPSVPQRPERKRPAPAMQESEHSRTMPPAMSEDPEMDTERYQFLRRLLSQEFSNVERDNHNGINSYDTRWSPSTIAFLSNRFARRFIPDTSRRDVNSKLTALAADISSCIAQHDQFNLQSVIHQLFGILALYFSICASDKTLDVLAQTIYTIHRLVSFYTDATQYMLRDLQRAGQEAIYIKLIRCVDDFLQTLNTDSTRKRIPAGTLPDLDTVSYKDIKAWCAANRVDPCVLQAVSKSTVSQETSENAILHIIDIYHHTFYCQPDIQSFHFLLREPLFLKLLSTSTPLHILSRVLDLLVRFTEDDNQSLFFVQTRMESNETLSVSGCLLDIINMRLPYESLYNEWYTVRIKSITLLEDTFAILSAEVRQEWVKPDLLVQLGQIIFNDVWPIMDVDKPPYRPIPLQLSGRFIHMGLHLLNDMLCSCGSAMDTSGKTHDALFKIYKKMLPTVTQQWPEKHPAIKELRRLQRVLRTMQGAMQTESVPTTLGTS